MELGYGLAEQRAAALFERGVAAQGRGEAEAAIRDLGEAAKVYRTLAAGAPDDTRLIQNLGAVLYSLGAALADAGRPEEAVGALDECGQAYTALAASHATAIPVDLLVADVRVRRGNAYATCGAGASAVLDVQAGIFVYRQNFATAPPLDAARVLAVGGSVLARYGDPDLASACADASIDLYQENMAAINRDGSALLHLPYLRLAFAVAESAHGSQGRVEQAARAAVSGESVRVSLPGDAPLPEWMNRFLAPPSLGGPPTSPLSRMSLGAAMAVARQAGADPGLVRELSDVLVRPDDEDAPARFIPLDRLLVPFGRRGLDLLPRYVIGLAQLALHARGADPAAGLRLGLETHYLLAGARQLEVPGSGELSPPSVPVWSDMLDLCGECAVALGDTALAADLARWRGRATLSDF